MRGLSIQVSSRKGRPFAAYIYLNRHLGQRAAKTEQVSSEVVVDYAADGRPIGIEIVTPEVVALDQIYEAFDRLGLGRPSPDDLKPLRAA